MQEAHRRRQRETLAILWKHQRSLAEHHRTRVTMVREVVTIRYNQNLAWKQHRFSPGLYRDDLWMHLVGSNDSLLTSKLA